MIEADRVEMSPNHFNGTPEGRLVIIHATRSGLPQNPDELEGTINWFKRDYVGLSAHWVIGRKGEKVRMVPDRRCAIHAGEHNTQAWGIELCQGVEDDGFTDAQLEALVAVCRGYMRGFNVSPVHTRDVTQSGFIGHEETPQGQSIGKSDPGHLFPWQSFIARLRKSEESAQKEEPVQHVTIIREPGDTFRTHLLRTGMTGWKLNMIPSEKVRQELASIYGISPEPVPVSRETWEYLTDFK